MSRRLSSAELRKGPGKHCLLYPLIRSSSAFVPKTELRAHSAAGGLLPLTQGHVCKLCILAQKGVRLRLGV